MKNENIKYTTRKKHIFFYLTLFYILSFLTWWTYLLYQKTTERYDAQLQYTKTQFDKESKSFIEYKDSESFRETESKFKREKIMIITEGAVFSILLIFLILKVKKSVENEIEMAKQQQNFILSITHELKSPLSSIKLMSETLSKHELNEEQKKKLLSNSLYEVDRLQNLVENVLLAAKIDNNSYGFVKKKSNLSELINQTIRQFQVSKKSSIEYSIEEDIYMKYDTSGMTSIIVNLLENAIIYSPEESPLNVKLSKKDDKVLLTVKDNGTGISDNEKGKVFKKFYRLGNEETRTSKGTGLGLYIVKKMVEFHHGKIQILDNKPNGTIFKIVFEL